MKMKKGLNLLAWAVVFVGSFFLSKLLVSPLLASAPHDADVGYAVLVGIARLVVWFVLLWVGMKLVRKSLQSNQ